MKSIPLLLAVALVTGCALGSLPGDQSTGFRLPADVVADVPRPAGEFTFQTVVPVEIALVVNLSDGSKGGRSSAAPGEGDKVFLSVIDPEGEALLTTMFESGRRFRTLFYIPTGSDRLSLKISAVGFESRIVDVSDPAAFASIDRTMALGPSSEPAAADELVDRDGDGVPNLYDAAPDDPLIAFIIQMRGMGSKGGTDQCGRIALSFEDNYPGLGDADFNDFLVQMLITEYYSGPNLSNRLAKIGVEAFAVAKLAGYDHSFGLVVHYPGISADLQVDRFDADGNPVSSYSRLDVSDKADVILFESTEQAAASNRGNSGGPDPKGRFHGYRSVLTISGLDGQALEPGDGAAEMDAGFDRLGVEAPPYDPYILVHQTGRDIHMIGKPALDGSTGVNGFIDANGFPWVLVVPSDWAHPAEAARIGSVYLDFDAWVASRGAQNPGWYDLETARVNRDLLVFPAYPAKKVISKTTP